MKITIWDTNPQRIWRIDKNLHLAMRQLGLNGTVDSMSEPPLVSRSGLARRIPVLEIDGNYWNLRPGEDISAEECLNLLRHIFGQPANA